ncbi:unnamed protein product [Phytophthora lilii]|uniref:Unnamed protein product n=1 Tax=Phytophthora lilii TaxID=2077276 RepID=A0A9W6YJ73_9STRA|nr:unnamed protein product [Phytophthora lilii]
MSTLRLVKANSVLQLIVRIAVVAVSSASIVEFIHVAAVLQRLHDVAFNLRRTGCCSVALKRFVVYNQKLGEVPLDIVGDKPIQLLLEELE